ncbi:acyl-CoA dehydrogenase [Actinophytocola glycyrrhizae]|uniref:Acyl-CoA dehydrogenase n=1 Tax=Actinophytocola glycyrrhizae TaxID=2044873 RepID=A0ABV9SC30_9PSEU
MRFMARERETAERYLPGLDARLGEVPQDTLESGLSPGLAIFRDVGGPGLMVGAEDGGLGASLVDAVRIHRLLGVHSPSLAIAVNMHTCTVAAIPPGPTTEDLLRTVAKGGLFMASAFAEGRPGTTVLEPAVRGERVDGGWRLSGSKKPCSLSNSMDILTASVLLARRAGDERELALAVIPASAPGIEVLPLGNGLVFPGSETNEVRLTDVDVPEEAVTFFGQTEELNAALSSVWLVFELLVSACYLGMASGLVRRVLDAHRGTSSDRTLLVGELEAAMAAIEAVAAEITGGAADPATVARTLHVRFAAQRSVERTSALATELLGGVGFMIGSTAQRYAACRALAFHPPSRIAVADPLDRFVAGEPLIVA